MVEGVDRYQVAKIEDAVGTHLGQDSRRDSDCVLDFLGAVVVFLEQEEGPRSPLRYVARMWPSPLRSRLPFSNL
jgi:hypothetical protein